MTASLQYYTIELLIVISYNVLSTIIINTAVSQTTRIPLMVFCGFTHNSSNIIPSVAQFDHFKGVKNMHLRITCIVVRRKFLCSFYEVDGHGRAFLYKVPRDNPINQGGKSGKCLTHVKQGNYEEVISYL